MSRSRPFGWDTEADMAAALVACLEVDGWDVYQEVTLHAGVADLVAVLGPRVVAVETKLSFGLAVLEQASRWVGVVHQSYAAVPRQPGRFGERLCRDLGVGLLQVVRTYGSTWECPVRWVVPAALHRGARVAGVLAKLDPGHKTHARAGAAGGGQWTPFRKTCEELRAVLVAAGGRLPQREAFARLKGRHHYASDAGMRSSLAGRVVQGVVPGVRREEVEGRVELVVVPVPKEV